MKGLDHNEIVTLSRVLHRLSKDFDADWEDILGTDRKPCLGPARAELARTLRSQNWKYRKIGEAMGGRRPSSIFSLIYGNTVRPKALRLERAMAVKTQASWVLDFIAEYHGMTADEMVAQKYARNDAIGHAVLVMRMQGLSFPQIGRALSRDHSTVHHHYRRMTRKGEST